MKPLYLLLLAVFAFACNNDDGNEPSSHTTGDITGTVTLYSEVGTCETMMDHSGVKVTLTLNGRPKTVETDSKGYFVFEKMPMGTYELKYEKENFGTYQQYSVKHLGGEPTVVSAISMTEKSTLEFSSVEISSSNSISLRFAETALKEKYVICNQYLFIVCISDSPDVSASNYKEVFITSYIGYPFEYNYGFSLYVNSPQLKGKKIYLKVYNSPYLESTAGYNSYFDIYKNLNVYPSVNKGSSVLSTTIF